MPAFLLCVMKKHVIIIYVCVFVMRYEKASFIKLKNNLITYIYINHIIYKPYNI